MPDFTSATYLGLRLARDDLRPWTRLTTGVPAALREPPLSRSVAGSLADLVGLSSGSLATSTLHAAVGLFGALDPAGSEILVDAGSYPIARWGVELARGQGAIVSTIPHQNPDAVLARLRGRRGRAARRRPIVLLDGFCPSCGRAASIAEHLAAALEHDGLVVIEDTQALGVLGVPVPGNPLGTGGGGVLSWTGTPPAGAVVMASLAKGFGVPVAVVAGSRPVVRAYQRLGATRVHCSPPSAAHLAAVAHALALNADEGDARRARLSALVLALRRGLRAAGADLAPGSFPVQTIRRARGLAPADLHRRLEADGVRAVLHTTCDGRTPAVSLIVRATHREAEIDAAVEAVRRAMATSRRSA